MKKKFIVFTLFFAFVSGFCFSFFDVSELARNIKNDSGWDSDYDSGGSSSSSGGSWGESSSSHGSNHSSSSEVEMECEFLENGEAICGPKENDNSDSYEGLIVFIIIIAVVVVAINMSEGFYYESDEPDEPDFEDVSDSVFEEYGLNKEEVKEELYNLFVEIQSAWMNFDYDILSKLCTNELFNTYKSQLNVLKLKNEKNIMYDFELLNCKIIKINKVKNKLNFTVYMKIRFNDYVINTKTNKVIRGDKYQLITNNYLMTFVKGNKAINKCPSCGAMISGHATDKCEYCKSVIVKETIHYILSKKSNINGSNEVE